MSQELLKETITLLSKTFTSTDKTDRESAEQRLKEMENDVLNNFKFILGAIKDGNMMSSNIHF